MVSGYGLWMFMVYGEICWDFMEIGNSPKLAITNPWLNMVLWPYLNMVFFESRIGMKPMLKLGVPQNIPTSSFEIACLDHLFSRTPPTSHAIAMPTTRMSIDTLQFFQTRLENRPFTSIYRWFSQLETSISNIFGICSSEPRSIIRGQAKMWEVNHNKNIQKRYGRGWKGGLCHSSINQHKNWDVKLE